MRHRRMGRSGPPRPACHLHQGRRLPALEWAVTSGRARYVGVSNYSGWQATHASTLMSRSRVPLVANEIEYNYAPL